jgi:glutamate racemase
LSTIGVIDSGVGGLGIFKLLVQQLPQHNFVYLADNKNMPFGSRTPEQLHIIAQNMLTFLQNEHDIDMLVVACNTLSVTALDFMRQNFPDLPIVGVVPVVKPACERSVAKNIAILATPITAASSYLKDLIATYAHDVRVQVIACHDLARMIEDGKVDAPDTLKKLETYLQPALKAGVDVIGLASTHYPFVRHHIVHMVPNSITILDSNEAVARRVIDLVQKHQFDPVVARFVRVYVTHEPDSFKRISQQLVGADIVTDVARAVVS